MITKGPWKAEILDGENKNVVIYTSEKTEGIVNVYPSPEAKSNAALIASAPEMLEMLKKALQFLHWEVPVNIGGELIKLQLELKNVIAKAEA